MASLHTVLRKFDATDTWESYSPELEHYFEVNSVLNDNERIAILLTVLSPSVNKVLSDSCRPELPRLKTYAELSELLKIHHSPKLLIFKHRTEFYSATQAPTESVNDWLGRVMRLAAPCDFGNDLDTVLKDNFVSGLANRRVACRLCEENRSATLVDLVDLAEKYAPLCSTETSILELPDEVLTKIISLLTARERLPLGNSCHRFKALVFEDPELLRHLDFSKKAGLTTMSHIQQYFNNENACQHILKINVRNVDCMKPGELLNNSIGKAINLVEVNIHGTLFEDIWRLGSFLKPLLHLEKLSINWPSHDENDISLCRRILQRPFSKLTYLSVRFSVSDTKIFTSCLSLCQQLKELYMKASYCATGMFMNSWSSEIKQLRNLKIVQYNCSSHRVIELKEELATVLPDPERWTDFQLCGPADPRGFYIEKDVEVCEELLESKRLQDILNTAPRENFKLKWALDPKSLLKEVLRITHEDVPNDLCCLSTFVQRRNLLTVEEAKLLLKNPRYQISQLHLNHDLERGCDAHLLASAFPNLTELVLSAVTRNLNTVARDPHFQRHLCRRYGPVPEKQDNSLNLDSSFKMLVENTPNLRHFTLNPEGLSIKDWDLDALYIISGWHYLETLHMREVPCEDGQFFIEIGKRCKNLQKLFLQNITFRKSFICQADGNNIALFQMLKYCRNLRDLTIRCSDIDQAEMFASLAKNVNLESVEAFSSTPAHSAAPWILSLENLIRQCPKLTTINCNLRFKTEDDYNEAVSAVKRIKGELCRPDFQIRVYMQTGNSTDGWESVVIGTVSKDFPQNEPFCSD